jgi:hypothetical protein
MNSKKKGENELRNLCLKKLIKKSGNSISDEGREVTGNPLQSCMLAEGFDEEIKTFYQYAE